MLLIKLALTLFCITSHIQAMERLRPEVLAAAAIPLIAEMTTSLSKVTETAVITLQCSDGTIIAPQILLNYSGFLKSALERSPLEQIIPVGHDVQTIKQILELLEILDFQLEALDFQPEEIFPFLIRFSLPELDVLYKAAGDLNIPKLATVLFQKIIKHPETLSSLKNDALKCLESPLFNNDITLKRHLLQRIAHTEEIKRPTEQCLTAKPACYNKNQTQMLIFSNKGRCLEIVDTQTGQCLKTYSNGKVITSAVYNTNNENHILIVQHDNSVSIIDIENEPRCIQKFMHELPVTSAVYNNAQTQILTTVHRGSVRIFDATNGKCLHEFKHDWITRARYNKNCTRLLAITGKETMIFDIKTGECLQTLEHDRPINSAVFNNNETCILTAGFDGLRIWDIATGICIKHLPSDRLSSAVYNESDETEIITVPLHDRIIHTTKLIIPELTKKQLLFLLWLDHYRVAPHGKITLTPEMLPLIESFESTVQKELNLVQKEEAAAAAE